MKKKMITRIILSISIGLLVLAVVSFVIVPQVLAATGCFPDTNGHWAEEFICWMDSNGITGGYPDGTYRPENRVTRAEMAVFAQRVHELSRYGQTWTGTGLGIELEGDGYPSILMNNTDATNSSTALRFWKDGAPQWEIWTDPSQSNEVSLGIYDYDEARYRLWFDEDGNTGINTTNPQASLHSVNSDSGISPDTTNIGVYGEGGNGVRGASNGGTGVVGESTTGVGGWFMSDSGNLILGFDSDPTLQQRFRVENDGDVRADGTFSGPADFAELMAADSDVNSFEVGDVLVIMNDGTIGLSDAAYDTTLAGVYSANPGFLGDEQIAEFGLDGADELSDEGRISVALLGIVPVKVTDQNGEIYPGDLLTTSEITGHAMKCTEPTACFGAVIGKALEDHTDGQGLIRVLVTLR